MDHSFEIDRLLTLTDLEGDDWGEPSYDSHLVTTVHALRHKPLCDFTVEDLRIVIGQSVSLPYLVPLAIEQLQNSLLVSGDLYPGDLLLAVLRSDPRFWRSHPDLWRKMLAVIDQIPALPADWADDVAFLEPNLRFLLARFRGYRTDLAPTADLVAHVLRLLRGGRWLDALTLYKDATGDGTAKAREAVEATAAQYGVPRP